MAQVHPDWHPSRDHIRLRNPGKTASHCSGAAFCHATKNNDGLSFESLLAPPLLDHPPWSGRDSVAMVEKCSPGKRRAPDKDGNAAADAARVSPVEHELLDLAIMWFRRDLRLADNPALAATARMAKRVVRGRGTRHAGLCLALGAPRRDIVARSIALLRGACAPLRPGQKSPSWACPPLCPPQQVPQSRSGGSRWVQQWLQAAGC